MPPGLGVLWDIWGLGRPRGCGLGVESSWHAGTVFGLQLLRLGLPRGPVLGYDMGTV